MKAFKFEKASPVWVKDKERERNYHLSFKAIIAKTAEAVINITASAVYRIFINGDFAAFGPARTAAGYHKVDVIDIGAYLKEGENVLIVEVVGFNINSTYVMSQPSFLCAEVIQNGKVTLYTDGEHFKCKVFHERVRKVQRYSYQRAFTECYRLTKETESFRLLPFSEKDAEEKYEELVTQESSKYIERELYYPNYEKLAISEQIESGIADFTYKCDNLKEDRSYKYIGKTLQGFKKEELTEHLSTEFQNISFAQENAEKQIIQLPLTLCNNEYRLLSFPYNATGFFSLEFICEKPITLYILFDEILIDYDIDTTRMECCNGFKISAEPGKYRFITMEPYTFKYLKIVIRGECMVDALKMIEFKHPAVPYSINLPKENSKLELIYKAALESFRANAVDTLSDCPSRERVGWLCDSFFSGRVERCLTGTNKVERCFLENYIIAEEFEHIPQGVLPMSYPSDHYDGIFIPNWAMWFVIELEEYYRRSHDRTLVDHAKHKIHDLLNYFIQFENEHGLLEKLDSWIFIEWSDAADFVLDINYPTNMLYALMLTKAADLYDCEEWAEKGGRIKRVIRERSYNGEFFTDNEVRENNILQNPGNITEVCQYYAFFTEVATPELYPELWERLLKSFGPERKSNNKYPKVHFANAFIGNYLRVEVLYRYHEWQKVLENIEGYFYDMALQTGTLWENDTPKASCNHGFASHIIYWLAGIYGIIDSETASGTTYIPA